MPFQKKSNKPKLKEKSAFGTQEKESKKTYSRFSRERIRDRKREILVTAKGAKENEKIVLSVKRKAELGN